MKKMIVIILLLLCLVSCNTTQTKRVEEQVKVIDKYSDVKSKYHYIGFNKGWETYTAYYLVLENGEVEEVDINDYAKYQIGDLYTIVYYEVVDND